MSIDHRGLLVWDWSGCEDLAPSEGVFPGVETTER